jgi:hypothetical protein
MKSAKGGRARALLTLDRMLAKHANQVKLAVELEKDFRENPVRFFKTIIMPLLPHEARLAVEQAGVVGWRSLVSATVTGPGLPHHLGMPLVGRTGPVPARKDACGGEFPFLREQTPPCLSQIIPVFAVLHCKT